MDATLRRSWPARITAIGFIAVIAFGNFALAELLLGQQVARWTMIGVWSGSFVVTIGGVSLGLLALWKRLKNENQET